MAEWKYGKLYAIADAEVLRARGMGLREFAEALQRVGVRVVQWRDKEGLPQDVLAGAAVLREVMGESVLLVMNDRVDLALIAGFGGVHVGQGDMAVGDALRVMMGTHSSRYSRDEWGTDENAVVGVSTHTEEQVVEADGGEAGYVAIGPVFATGTKADAAAVVGLEGVRRARTLTTKPLVAIGGITRENCRSVVEAGADAVAVISGLFGEGERVEDVLRDFLGIFG